MKEFHEEHFAARANLEAKVGTWFRANAASKPLLFAIQDGRWTFDHGVEAIGLLLHPNDPLALGRLGR